MVEFAQNMETQEIRDWASKVNRNVALSDTEKNISKQVDAWAKKIGENGADSNREISAFIIKTMDNDVYDKPDALLDLMFDRDSIGEFDDYRINKTPKNTLVAYEAAKGGNVNRSYIDTSYDTPVWKHLQVETDIKYSDLRRNGFRTIANLTMFAEEALLNKKIKAVFDILDGAITGGDQVIAVTGSEANLTIADMDKLALYTIDHIANGDTPLAFGLNKYAQKIAKMAGYDSYMSDSMKDDYNRYGLVKLYGGMLISGFSGARKAADGELLVPDKRIFGVSGRIGTICDRGELRVYETMDNNAEKIDLKFTGYEFGVKVTDASKVAKITFTA